MATRGRPSSDRGRAAASKERALAHLRWGQLRVLRREWKPVSDFEATLAQVLAMLRDRFMALPDHMDMTPQQREMLRQRIAETLQACSEAEV
jgi:hypothetical protein